MLREGSFHNGDMTVRTNILTHEGDVQLYFLIQTMGQLRARNMFINIHEMQNMWAGMPFMWNWWRVKFDHGNLKKNGTECIVLLLFH